MTSTDNTTEPTTPETTTAAAGERLGEILLVDPASLIVGVNVRQQVHLDRGFLRDIAERGVREPITVRRDNEGRLVVRKGQRRTLGAVEAGLARVRVFVDPDPETESEHTAGQIDRIIDQLAENHHRAGVCGADRVRAHQQLLDLGLSAGQIARKTRVDTREVRAIHHVARSPLATAALGRYELTLDQAAAIAEFSTPGAGTDDASRPQENAEENNGGQQQDEADREAVLALTAAATEHPEQFPHVLQRARDARNERRLIAAREAELRGQGVRVIDAETRREFPDTTALTRLRPDPDSPSGTALRPEEHTDCPGHAVMVRTVWFSQGQTDLEFYCTDPAAHGHTARYDHQPEQGQRSGSMSEQDKAERKRVIALNKAWDSATTVRREWVTAFLARKTPPKDAAAFIATALAAGHHRIRKAMEGANATACELLGLQRPAGYHTGTPNPISEQLARASAARATQLSLAVILGAYEEGAGRHSWRNPMAEDRHYLQTLAAWNYPLSEVERLAAGLAEDSPAEDSEQECSMDDPDGAEATTEPAGR